MGNFVFNIAKGKVKWYVEQVDGSGNERLVLIPLESSGLESDATLIDKDDVAAVLSGTTNEQTTAGRKTISSATTTVNDTSDRWEGDFADQTYTAIAASNAIAQWVVAFDADTTSGNDSNLIPLTCNVLAWTPDGNNFTVQVADFVRSI